MEVTGSLGDTVARRLRELACEDGPLDSRKGPNKIKEYSWVGVETKEARKRNEHL